MFWILIGVIAWFYVIGVIVTWLYGDEVAFETTGRPDKWDYFFIVFWPIGWVVLFAAVIASQLSIFKR